MRLFRKKSHHGDKSKPRAIAQPQEDTPFCCGRFSFFRRVKDYYSPDYANVCLFLYNLRDNMRVCHHELNKIVLASAIKSAREFHEITQTTEETYEDMLNDAINNLKCEFLLKDGIETDYSQLKQYCVDQEIKIPNVIKDVLNRVESIELTLS